MRLLRLPGISRAKATDPAPEGRIVWLTGLSGAGKSTLSEAIAARLREAGRPVEILDGDIIRQHLGQGLGYSRDDRDINVRRVGFVAGLLARHGVDVVVAAISPYRSTRDEVRALAGKFLEVFVKCPVEELLRRDTKGLYERARRGEIANFTGISDPYEEPLTPDVIIETDRESVEAGVDKVLRALTRLGLVHLSLTL